MTARYRMKRYGFSDLARTTAFAVEDSQAVMGGSIAIFSESRYGTEARKMAIQERDRLNTAAEGVRP